MLQDNKMIDEKRAKLDDEINSVFLDGTILTTKEEKLQEYLMSLCSNDVPNDTVQHRELIRALTINHIQMQRHIDELDKKSSFLQKLVIALAAASLIGTAIQVYTTLQPHRPNNGPIGSETILKPIVKEQPLHTDKSTTVKTTISSKPPYEKKK
jgi:hypothetical protein